jgi:DNA-binding transcriptional LysR family regulator
MTVNQHRSDRARCRTSALDTRCLERYVVLSEEKSFRRAAFRLGVSQPALTRQIKALEREFNTYFFERHRSGIRLTTAGQIFLEYAERISDGSKKLRQDIEEASTGRSGRIAIGFQTSLSSCVMSTTLRQFRSHANPRIELHEGTVHEQLHALRSHRIELALTIGPISDPDLNTESLWTERLAVILPTDHGLNLQEPLLWSNLDTERLIVRSSEHDHWVAQYITNLATTAGARPQISEFATTRENVVGLVRAGFGIGLLPESSMLSVNTDGLVWRLMSGPCSEMEIVGVWLPENANPVLRRFLDQIHLAVQQCRCRETQRRAPR